MWPPQQPQACYALSANLGSARDGAKQENLIPLSGCRDPLNVRFGSKADIGLSPVDVRYSPKSGHSPGAILRPMKVEEIAEVVARLPPDQLARFRRWFTAFEAGRTDHAEELDSTATKLGRLAGRTFAELKKRAKEPRE
jgi:hypothetical protein